MIILLARWAADWAYALWVTVVPPRNNIADLACGHSFTGMGLHRSAPAWCPLCRNHTHVRAVRRRPR